MKVVDISNFEDSVVLHFETETQKINAYTLASTLVAIADAAKAANTTINAGYEVEIIVEALGAGSFRAKISAIYKEGKNLFTSQLVAGVIIGVIANYVYERTLAVDDNVKIEIHTDEVIIEKGDEKIIVPRNVYDATREVEKNPKFTQAIEKSFQAIEKDNKIEGIGFVKNINDPKPEVIIPRSAIISASGILIEEDGVRIVTELVELQILKAILERGRRKWEFMWRGFKISAPITDDAFYNDFFAHNITIAPGDSLQVKLQIKQIKDEDTGIYRNKSYEVIEIHEHHPRLKQTSIET
tara:strand:+ start:6750 stop:7643 length:894 start_codon:yes stop_codon:yes gene_type:complete